MMLDFSFPKLFRTVRHLRAAQVVGQVRVRFHRDVGAARVVARLPVPPYPGVCWKEDGVFPLPCEEGAHTSKEILSGLFTFINQKADLSWPPDWKRSMPSLLWAFNLHYFNWLWSLEYTAGKSVVRDWIESQEPNRWRVASPSMSPYTTSLRLVNWLGYFWGSFRKELDGDPDFRNELWASVFGQTEWLMRNPEYHIRANHLFENAAALVLAGACFEGESATAWYRKGFRILEKELPEQFLSDGLHYERSPMYHLRMSYLLQLLTQFGGDDVRTLVAPVYDRARAALSQVCHPDGAIALMNDSAFGVYPPVDCPAPASGAWALPVAGYYGFRNDEDTYVICDAGPIGPDYQSGHSHGDIFSFELSWRGSRVIVDSGVYEYLAGEMRKYGRSTRAHNTVEINGEDQGEFWGAFYVGRRGRPFNVSWNPSGKGFSLTGQHDGYHHLPGRPEHERQILWEDPGRLTLKDRVSSTREVRAASRLHFHPDCEVLLLSDREADISFPGGALRVRWEGSGVLKKEPSWYCPQFNQKISNMCLAFESRGHTIETFCVIEEKL